MRKVVNLTPHAITIAALLDDLLTPGQQIRDESGRIVGCRSLARVR